jgi:hypothetical protein
LRTAAQNVAPSAQRFSSAHSAHSPFVLEHSIDPLRPKKQGAERPTHERYGAQVMHPWDPANASMGLYFPRGLTCAHRQVMLLFGAPGAGKVCH